jgi:hypothetical protein
MFLITKHALKIATHQGGPGPLTIITSHSQLAVFESNLIN